MNAIYVSIGLNVSLKVQGLEFYEVSSYNV